MSENIDEARWRVEDAQERLRQRRRAAFPSVKLGFAGIFGTVAVVAPWDSVKAVFGTAAAGMTVWAMMGYYKRDVWGMSDHRLVKMAQNILDDAEFDLSVLEEKENGGKVPAAVQSEFSKLPSP